jgi:hypothetical protein
VLWANVVGIAIAAAAAAEQGMLHFIVEVALLHHCMYGASLSSAALAFVLRQQGAVLRDVSLHVVLVVGFCARDAPLHIEMCFCHRIDLRWSVDSGATCDFDHCCMAVL